jgi:hypothetical protein
MFLQIGFSKSLSMWVDMQELSNVFRVFGSFGYKMAVKLGFRRFFPEKISV